MTSDWPGVERRECRLDQPDYLTLQGISQRLREFLDTQPMSAGGRVLDIGCGEKPYLPLFEKLEPEYIGIDLQPAPTVDCTTSPDMPIPYADNHFDLVLCTQVLEHLRNPFFSVGQMHRVLKKGGWAFVSVPFVWEVHGYPQDYWRFTPQALEILFENFSSKRVLQDSNSLQTILQAFHLWVNRQFEKDSVKKRFFKISNRHLMRWAGRFGDRLLPANLIVIAQK